MLSLKRVVDVDLTEGEPELKRQKVNKCYMFEKLHDTMFVIMEYLELDDRRIFSRTCKEAAKYAPVTHRADDPKDDKKLVPKDDLVVISFYQLEETLRYGSEATRIREKYKDAENVRIEGRKTIGNFVHHEIFSLFPKVKLLEVMGITTELHVYGLHELQKLRIYSSFIPFGCRPAVWIAMDKDMEEMGIYLKKTYNVIIQAFKKEKPEYVVKNLHGNCKIEMRTGNEVDEVYGKSICLTSNRK